MNGLNSPVILNQVPAEQKDAVGEIQGAEIDMVLNCANDSIKINSFKMTDASGYTMESSLNSSWVQLSKPDDIQKLRELCFKL